MPAALLFLVSPVFGFVLGFAGKRWRVAIVSAVLACAIAASGWLFGWTSDSETPALGGAILLLVLLGVPFVGGVCLGIAWSRPGRARGR